MLFRRVEFSPEAYMGGPSQTFRDVPSGYGRKPAMAYNDHRSRLTDRVANFYRNLVGLAEAVHSRELPVDFEAADGRRIFLDRGCVKMAVNAGFLTALEDDGAGVVSTVRLAWDVE